MSTTRTRRSQALATTVARRVRQLPGGPEVAGRLVGRLRESPLARKVVSRVFDVDVSGLGGTVFLSAGDLLGGQGRDNLPVVLVSLVGADDEDVSRLVETVAQEQVLTGGFRPVVILDSDHLAEVRQYGYPVEYIVPRAAWSSTDVLWEEYLTTRLASLRRTYQATGSVDLARSGAVGSVYLRSFGPTR